MRSLGYGTIACFGPQGESADPPFTDERYWIQLSTVLAADSPEDPAEFNPTGFVPEIQTLAIAGTPTAGSFTVTLEKPDHTSGTTGSINYSGTWATVLSNIQAALDTLCGASKVIAGGSGWTGITFTFQGTEYAGANTTAITAAIGSLIGATGATSSRTRNAVPAPIFAATNILETGTHTHGLRVGTVVELKSVKDEGGVTRYVFYG